MRSLASLALGLTLLPVDLLADSSKSIMSAELSDAEIKDAVNGSRVDYKKLDMTCYKQAFKSYLEGKSDPVVIDAADYKINEFNERTNERVGDTSNLTVVLGDGEEGYCVKIYGHEAKHTMAGAGKVAGVSCTAERIVFYPKSLVFKHPVWGDYRKNLMEDHCKPRWDSWNYEYISYSEPKPQVVQKTSTKRDYTQIEGMGRR